MADIENLVPEGAENVEGTTTEEIVDGAETGSSEQAEETPEKLYTEDELNKRVDELLGKKIARKEAKIRKAYEEKYGDLENVIRAGTGNNDVAEVTKNLRQFYESKGVQIPTTQPTYSDRDITVLAQAEAKEIIDAGFDDVIEEVERLADIGLANMNAREKAVFKELAEYRQNAERGKELSKIGVTEDVYNSKEFKDFASQFKPSTSIVEIYNLYNKTQPKKEVQTMGSMKSNTPDNTGVKDFYTRDEALKFTKKDFDRNPELFKAVERSMLKW